MPGSSLDNSEQHRKTVVGSKAGEVERMPLTQKSSTQPKIIRRASTNDGIGWDVTGNRMSQ
jgi:hypothetical protein